MGQALLATDLLGQTGLTGRESTAAFVSRRFKEHAGFLFRRNFRDLFEGPWLQPCLSFPYLCSTLGIADTSVLRFRATLTVVIAWLVWFPDVQEVRWCGESTEAW